MEVGSTANKLLYPRFVQNSWKTTNMFGGMWHLPHSQVHND